MKRQHILKSDYNRSVLCESSPEFSQVYDQVHVKFYDKYSRKADVLWVVTMRSCAPCRNAEKAGPWRYMWSFMTNILLQSIDEDLLLFPYLAFDNLSVLSWWNLNLFRSKWWKFPARPESATPTRPESAPWPHRRWSVQVPRWCAWPASVASTRSFASTTASDRPTPPAPSVLESSTNEIAPFLSAVCCSGNQEDKVSLGEG